MTFRISKEVLAQELAGETVLLDLASENYFGLNAMGSRIWQLLKEGQNKVGIVETLLLEYEAERDVLENDVNELLDRLDKAGLIEID